MFPYQPPLADRISLSSDRGGISAQVGDIREPWTRLAGECGITEFEAKALFCLGMVRRYVLSANEVLRGLRHQGFASGYALLSSGVELLGRCVHPDTAVRQHPIVHAGTRLAEGFQYMRNRRLGAGVILETNHHPQSKGGYNVKDLRNLRNLVTHGGCITSASSIKGDIELLHQLRKLLYGVPLGETEPHQGPGPIPGALDRYYEALGSGDATYCERLATAAISPVPLRLQAGEWPFDASLIHAIKVHIEQNLARGRPPVSGGHAKRDDHFQLYP
jgi:hypothetical protein